MLKIKEIDEAIKTSKPVRIEAPQPLLRELPPADQFPIKALGEMLGAAAQAIHNKTQAPVAICAQSVLAAATLAVQGHANVTLPTGQSKPVSEFFLTIGASGERKSACDTEALRAIRKHEENLREQYSQDLPSHIDFKEVWEKQRQTIINDKKVIGIEAKREALAGLGKEPIMPLIPLLTPTDPTFEGLAKLYVNGHPSLGLFTAEGGMFIGGHGMSQDNKLKTATGLSGLWDGEPIRRVRAGDGITILPGRRLALHLMAQPDVATVMLSDRILMDQGLLSRLLVTAPDTAVGLRLWRETGAECDKNIRIYESALLRILETTPKMAEDKLNELEPRNLSLSVNARAMWIKFVDYAECQMASGGEMEAIRGLANKLPEHATRLAGVLALVENINATEVKAEHLAAGIELAQHYASEALRLFTGGIIDPDILLAQITLDWLQTKWTEPCVSLRALYQFGPNRIRTAKVARQIAGILEKHGWLIQVENAVEIDGHSTLDAWRIVSGEKLPC